MDTVRIRGVSMKPKILKVVRTLEGVTEEKKKEQEDKISARRKKFEDDKKEKMLKRMEKVKGLKKDKKGKEKQ